MPMRNEGLCVRGGAPMGAGARRARAAGAARACVVCGPALGVRVRVGLAGRVCQCVRAVWSVLCGGRMVLFGGMAPFCL